MCSKKRFSAKGSKKEGKEKGMASYVCMREAGLLFTKSRARTNERAEVPGCESTCITHERARISKERKQRESVIRGECVYVRVRKGEKEADRDGEDEVDADKPIVSGKE
jgi:hypothetical protein